MRMKSKVVLSFVLLLLLVGLTAGDVRREINIPDILDYKTLKCDLHMHTVFSDGLVWPTVRVDEAWREGLDAISITDHIEYQPHKEDIPTNHNRPYEIALSRAKQKNILLIRGAEFTRETPPGHFNAIFLKDIDPLDTKDLFEAIKAADKQESFIFWNHPGWKPEAKGWFDFHTKLYENKLLHGIELEASFACHAVIEVLLLEAAHEQHPIHRLTGAAQPQRPIAGDHNGNNLQVELGCCSGIQPKFVEARLAPLFEG